MIEFSVVLGITLYFFTMPLGDSLAGSISARRLQRHADSFRYRQDCTNATIAALSAEIAALERDNERLLAENVRLCSGISSPARAAAPNDQTVQTELVAGEEAAGACSFFFVPVAHLRSADATMPRFQTLREEGKLVEKLLKRSECYRRSDLANTVLAVSHRWEHPDMPDTQGVQLNAIRAHLDASPTIEFVWFE